MKPNQTLRWLWQVPGSKKWYIFSLILIQACIGFFGVLFSLLLRSVVDSAVGHQSKEFWHYVIWIICLIVVQIGFGALNRWLQELSKSSIENLFKERLFNNILRKDFGSISAIHTGEWINRLTNDAVVVANGYVEILPGLVGTVVRLIAAVIMIIALEPWFAYIIIPGGIALIILTYIFRKRLKILHKNIQENDGQLRIFLQERIGSLMVIKSFASEQQTSQAAKDKMDRHKSSRMKRNAFSNVCNTGFSIAIWTMYLIGIFYCAYGILTGTVSYGTLTAIMSLIAQIQAPFSNISGYLPRYYAMSASAERLMEAEQLTNDVTPEDILPIQEFYKKTFEKLGFENISFTYSSENSEAVLNDFSMEIKKGEAVAIIGQSGCGKSTLLKLLMCLYPVDAGNRYINEEELTAFYRRMFAYVPQGNILMNGSIRDIVCFARPEDSQNEAAIQKALQIACADEFVDDIDLILGEHGSGLSEGQMQRIAIARAIFSDAPILLLDEATSALDEETEQKLLMNLKSLTDKTVIIVTHRKAVLTICDRVVPFGEES